MLRPILHMVRNRDSRLTPDNIMFFFMILLFIEALTLIDGEATSDSVASQLDSLIITIWGILLALGSATTMVGYFLLGLQRLRWGPVFTQFGLAVSALSVLYYAACVFLFVGSAGLRAGILSIGLSAACLLNWYRIVRVVNDAEHEAAIIKMQGAVNDRLVPPPASSADPN